MTLISKEESLALSLATQEKEQEIKPDSFAARRFLFVFFKALLIAILALTGLAAGIIVGDICFKFILFYFGYNYGYLC